MALTLYIVCLLLVVSFFPQCAKPNHNVPYKEKSIIPNQLMQLSFNCPDIRHGFAAAILRTEGPAKAIARCKNGDFEFKQINLYELALTMSVADDVPGKCQMWLYGDGYPEPSMNIKFYSTYCVVVVYAPGYNQSEIYFGSNRENLICNYDRLGVSYMNISKVIDPPKKPLSKEKPIYRGNIIPHKITMDVVDIDDKPIQGGTITMSTMLRFRAVIHHPTRSIKALSCTVQNDVGTKHKMILSGCGDDMIFAHDDGFVSIGNVSYSPYFKVFRLAGSYNVRFTCLFSSCKMSVCNNTNSCYKAN